MKKQNEMKQESNTVAVNRQLKKKVLSQKTNICLIYILKHPRNKTL